MKPDKKIFLSCDWGSSRFRLRLVDALEEKVLGEIESGEGIVATFTAWKKTGKAEPHRFAFYCSVIQKHIGLLEQKMGTKTTTPIIVSGMASSTLGMKELPYKATPFLITGDDLLIDETKPDDNFHFPLYQVSGIKTADDVMRGEETQILGCGLQGDEAKQIIILPGTHSKHAVVCGEKVVSFATFMTGELFRLLAQHSMLAQSVAAGTWDDIRHQKTFAKGVTDSASMNLLQSSFRVRINDLFHRLSKEENYFYLSGLVIGTELQSLDRSLSHLLVADKSLSLLYTKALQVMKFLNWKHIDANDCLLKGHLKIYRRIVDGGAKD
ncbi:2-dehydro-3-deoxygalactonokinase [Flavisolibacter ginsenosidimutans]|uniref:2-dehydro-3-deoxygalactonokinase n=1 Tax=Flavisolibacter ginsenosidimutans TaxID=661481 RepID=A0A5B8UCJ4_9BACT|nr:2-dehydro-3-deoxygalactonokinase [Flavisolibacter ginsenosidimutans]QEC54387.1 2-dehydro-3-deoxygalactonokinase [Flavisolibacter ginsenosidimutans]